MIGWLVNGHGSMKLVEALVLMVVVIVNGYWLDERND